MRDISPWRRIIRISVYFYLILIIIEVINIAGEGTFKVSYFLITVFISLVTGVVYALVIFRRAQLIISDDQPELNEWLDFHIQSFGYEASSTNKRGIDVFAPSARHQLPASGPILRYHQGGKIHLFGLQRQLEKLQYRLERSPGLSRSAKAYFA